MWRSRFEARSQLKTGTTNRHVREFRKQNPPNFHQVLFHYSPRKTEQGSRLIVEESKYMSKFSDAMSGRSEKLYSGLSTVQPVESGRGGMCTNDEDGEPPRLYPKAAITTTTTKNSPRAIKSWRNQRESFSSLPRCRRRRCTPTYRAFI